MSWWRALGVIALVLFGAAIAAREFLGNPYESVVRHATRAAAESAGEFTRGWLPNFVPASATGICEAMNLDTNEICATFSVADGGGAALLADLLGRGFENVARPATTTTRCTARDACGFRQLGCAGAPHILVGPQEDGRRPYVAIDARDHRVCYWTAHAD